MILARASRNEKIAAGLWIMLAAFLGNGIYDVMVARGAKEFLFRHALSEAGRGPAVPLAPLMHETVVNAALVGTLWGAMILAVGALTLWLLRRA